MDLSDAERLARYEMGRYHLNEWHFAWNDRKTAAGLCSYRKQTIELSRALTPHRAEGDVRDTVLHEIAHALCGPKAGHSRTWRAKARELGARPTTCIADTAAVSAVARGKYRAVCPQCGPLSTYRHRRTNRVHSHRRCGSVIGWQLSETVVLAPFSSGAR